MAHWSIKKEYSDREEHNLIVFITDDEIEFETMFDAPDEYVVALQQGVKLNVQESGAIVFLENIYPIETAIDVVTAFRFKEGEDVIDAKFMLAPSLQEAQKHLEYVDSQDIQKLLDDSDISINKFAKTIQAPVRTVRDKMNVHKSKSQLSFAEKYLANVLFYSTN